MTALAEPVPSARAETDQKKNEEDDVEVSAPAIAGRESGKERVGGVAGTIRRLFKEVSRALTTRLNPAPQGKRRRRSEETWVRFRMLARKIVRRVTRLPPMAYMGATFLDNPLDPLNPYWHNPADWDEHAAPIQPAEENHLSPHL